MNMGYKQGNTELMYLGLGLPLWLYFLIIYTKWINKIEVEQDYFKVKNIIFGNRIIKYSEIEQWQEIYTMNLFAHNLLLKVKGKKIVISNMIDSENYETLHHRLRTHWADLENK